jgi:EthD domain-containing protein
MEKVVYVLWRPAGDSSEAFADRLRGDVAGSLLDLGVRGLQVNVADNAVATAMVRMVELDPQMEAVVSVWLETVMDGVRRPIEDVLAGAASRAAGYLVTESTPLHNTTRAAALGERTDGFSNIAFLRRPTRLTREAWLDAWQNGHSQLAIDTQSTFGYTQNVVVRGLTPNAPAFDGIVEELFPFEALTDLHAFFDAVGDDEKLTKNMTAMGESTERFGASESIDVVPTSQYVFATPFT